MLMVKLSSKKKLSSCNIIDLCHSNLANNKVLLQQRLSESLEPISFSQATDVEASWDVFRDNVYNTSANVLGFPKRSHQDWFGESDLGIQPLLNQLHSSHKSWINCESSTLK